MGFFKKIREKWDNWYYRDFEDEPENWEEEVPEVEVYDGYYDDEDTRTVYVLECLGQMEEASKKIDTYQSEYDAVTGLLMDMEEIDELSPEAHSEVTDLAKRIENLEKERRIVFRRSGRLAESRITLLERYEDDIPKAIDKMYEAEDYRKLVKRDLRKLEAERNSCRYQIREAKATVANSRGIAMICAFSMFLSIFLLLFLQFGCGWENMTVGYLIICAAGAIALTVLFVRYQDANRSLKMLEKLRNKLIGLHNTVKIRYVNNTNLLQYMYMKYDVESADELDEDWGIYIEELNARERDETLKSDLEYYYNKLTEKLGACNIKDPEIWTRQSRALVDPKEMVEVRHALIARRQKLRERLEYNREVAETAQGKIKTLAKDYPQYSKEIADIVNRYECR